MAFAAGDEYSTSAYWKKKGSSVPSKYTVFLHSDDAKYYAVCNTPNGTNLGPETYASTVINTALQTPGIVHLKGDATYTLAASLELNSQSVLEGEGTSTILQPIDGLDLPAITLSGTQIHNTIMSSFQINGNSGHQTSTDARGIYLNNPVDWNNPVTGNCPHHTIENVVVRNCYGNGIKLEGYVRSMICYNVLSFDNLNTGFYLTDEHCTDGFFTSCIAGSNIGHGFYVAGGDNQFVNCKSFGNTLDGLHITGWQNMWTSGILEENTRAGAYLLGTGAGTDCYNNQIGHAIIDNNAYGIVVKDAGIENALVDNSILDLRTPMIQVGLTLDNTDYTIVHSNDVNNNATRVSLLNGPLYTDWKDNFGYKTRNGSMGSGASPITVTHGLVATPGMVVLTVKKNAATVKCSWTNEGAATFDIIHDGVGAEDIIWEAWCEP